MYASAAILNKYKNRAHDVALMSVFIVLARVRVGIVRAIRFSDINALGVSDSLEARRLFDDLLKVYQLEEEHMAARYQKEIANGLDLMAENERLFEAFSALLFRLESARLDTELSAGFSSAMASLLVRQNALSLIPGPDSHEQFAHVAARLMELERAADALA